MIKASELMIRNVVFDPSRSDHDFEGLGNGVYRVSAQAIERFDAGWMTLEPVELTPEWLDRFGFTGNATEGYGLDVFELNYITTDDHFQLEYKIAGIDKWFIVELKHVHQLQNLFFTLTGRELELKK